jgi:deoxyribodipyrimidine photo-lyase
MSTNKNNTNNTKITNTKAENGLFIFRRDYRIIDNIGLLLASSKCSKVFTVFIFTPEQVSSANKFKSDNAVQFMIESLQDLASEIAKKGGHLYTFYGKNETIIKQLIKDLDIDAIFFNEDYSPYAVKRDQSITDMTEKMKIQTFKGQDYYLLEPGTILNGSNNTYQKFTPFYNVAHKKHVELPSSKQVNNFAKTTKQLTNVISLDAAFSRFTTENENIMVKGGRPEAIATLKKAIKTQAHYSKTHNDLIDQTTGLSAYIKFGCLSIREVYKAFRNNTDLIRQLWWRDFYANILFAFPHVIGHAMKPNYNKIAWHNNSSWFKAWTKGLTGYPVVDAGMRQLKVSGYMHNRARLIVASFLVKTLLISWEHGEQYFAKMLTDYDPASNNGNWQWIAGSGADSQPYFRIFSPKEQTKSFDPDCEYIKKWIPELKDVPVKDIINWDTEYVNYINKTVNVKYVKPICDFSTQKEHALSMYEAVFK